MWQSLHLLLSPVEKFTLTKVTEFALVKAVPCIGNVKYEGWEGRSSNCACPLVGQRALEDFKSLLLGTGHSLPVQLLSGQTNPLCEWDLRILLLV